MVDIAGIVGAIPPIFLFAAASIVLLAAALELIPRRSRAQPLAAVSRCIGAAKSRAEPKKAKKTVAPGGGAMELPVPTSPSRHTYVATSAGPSCPTSMPAKSRAHPLQAFGHRNVATAGASTGSATVARPGVFVPSPFTIAPRNTDPSPRTQSAPISSPAGRIARDFVWWAIERGHVAELVREDILRLAHDHFAPETGTDMPRDNAFSNALKNVAGVECRSCRAIYHQRGPYAGARTTYRIWPEVARRDRQLDRAAKHVSAA